MNTILNHNALEPVGYQPHQLRAILLTVCLALMAVIASVTGLNVAQQKLAVEFNASQHTVLWMINSYTISLSALLLPLGAIGDRWGRRSMLLLGLAVFGLASVASGLATSSGMMLVARVLSGVGAAMIMPITLAVITATFPDEQRSKAIGVWTGVAGGGGILGMYLSALLVDLANWRWLFVLPVVLIVVATGMTLRLIPNSREKTGHRFDIIGSVLSVISVLGIAYALHEAPGDGWTAPRTLTSLLIGLLGIVGFVQWELRQRSPLLDVRLLAERGLSGGSLTLLTVFGVQAGIMIVLFPYFQGVLGWSGLRSTLAMLPMALLMMAASGLAPKVAARLGSRLTMATGVILGASGLALLATLVSVDGGYLSVLPGLLTMGLGMGLAMTPSTEAITSSLPVERQGVASALNDITRELGTALGVALLGALVTSGYSRALTTRLHGVPAHVVAVAKAGLANALAIPQPTDAPSAWFRQAARESFVEGWQQAMWVGTAILVGLFVYLLVRGPFHKKALRG